MEYDKEFSMAGMGDYGINQGWGFLLWVKLNLLTIQNSAWVGLVAPLLSPVFL